MKIKIFYGWYIVLSGAFLSFYFASIVGYGWTAFVTPIISTFGWSMAQVSLASSLRSLQIGVFSPLWGPVVDRYSPRWLMRLGVVCASVGLFCLSRMQTLIMYYIGFLLVGVGSSLVTGMLPLVVISRWFRKDIGKANGLFFMGVGFGGVVTPLVVTAIDRQGYTDCTDWLFSELPLFADGRVFGILGHEIAELKNVDQPGDCALEVRSRVKSTSDTPQDQSSREEGASRESRLEQSAGEPSNHKSSGCHPLEELRRVNFARRWRSHCAASSRPCALFPAGAEPSYEVPEPKREE